MSEAGTDIEQRSHSEIHDDKGKTFIKFVQKLDDEDRVRFLRSLTEQEKVDFCSSEEEFRMVMGRESNVPFGEAKPIREEDVTEDVVDTEELQERLEKARRMFPGKPPKTLDEMRSLASGDSPNKGMRLQLLINLSQGDDPTDGPHMTLDKLKEKVSGRGRE